MGKPALASAKFSTESESRGKNPYSEKAPIKTLLQPERGPHKAYAMKAMFCRKHCASLEQSRS